MFVREKLALAYHLANRVIIRYWRRQKLKTLALLIVVALGVSAFLSVGLTNRAAVNSFRSFTDIIAGQSQYSIRSSFGSLTLEDARSVRKALMETEASLFPTIEVMASAHSEERLVAKEIYKLIGIDLLSAANHYIRNVELDPELKNPEFDDSDIFEYLAEESTFFASDQIATANGWEKGDSIILNIGARQEDMIYSGALPVSASDSDRSPPALVMDLYSLARLANRHGQVDRIEIVVPESLRSKASLSRIPTLLKNSKREHWIIDSNASRLKTGAVMTLALRTNLRALSSLSLAIAFLLVFQALDSSVSQRRREIASLRSLGVTVRQIRILWIGEAAIIGAVGGIMGIGLASMTARIFSGMVNETVSTLYYFTADGSFSYAPLEILLAWIAAVATSIVAGWFPARTAASTPPAQLLKNSSAIGSIRYASFSKAAIFFGALAFVACLLPPLPAPNGHGTPIGGYLGALAANAFFIAIGCVLLEFLPRAVGFISTRRSSLLVGLSRLRRPVSRHRLALGSIIVAVGMTAAMIILIGSFEKTITSWMEQVIHADVYIRSKDAQSAEAGNSIPLEIVKAISDEKGIEDLATITRYPVNIDNMDTAIMGYDTGYLIRKPHLAWLSAKPNLSSMKSGESAIITESFQDRFDRDVGSFVTIETPAGKKRLRIIGIQADFGNERGSIGVDQSALSSWTDSNDAQGIALHLSPDTDIEVFVDHLEQRYPALQIAPNRILKTQAKTVFHQTFAITYALEGVGLFISVAGLGAMLFSSLLERRGEVSALRRLGMSRKGLTLAAITEAIALSGLGTACGVGLGLVQGWILIFIVNKQAFGWTLSLSIPWYSLAFLTTATLLAGALVSWRIGWWSSGLPIQQEE